MTENIWRGKNLLVKSLPILVPFELIYKLFGYFIVVPIIAQLFTFAIKLSKFSYITQQNIFLFMSRPFTIFVTIICFFLFLVYTLFEVAGITVCMDRTYFKKKNNILVVFKETVKRIRYSFLPRNLPIFFLVGSSIFIFSLGGSNDIINNISLVKYINMSIEEIPWLYTIFTVFLCVIYFIGFIFMFTYQYYILNKETATNAYKKSFLLMRKKNKDLLIELAKFNLVVTLPFLLFFGLIIGVLILVILGSNTLPNVVNFLFNILAGASTIMAFIMSTIFMSANLAYFQATFYSEEDYHLIPNEVITKEIKLNLRVKKIDIQHHKLVIALTSIIALFLVGQGVFFYIRVSDGALNHFEAGTMVTAHRGSSKLYPENSMVAFEKAIEDGIDYIELDVQLTKDKKVIVMHDNSLKRTTGVNIDVWDANYEDIKDLDVGSWFSKEYSYLRIPTLEEVLLLCDNKIKVNIEIKDNGHISDIAQYLHVILEEYHFVGNGVISSTNIDVLRELKEYNDDYEVGYVISMIFGSYSSIIDDIDFFSINMYFATQSLVNNLHKHGKKVFVWTVNSSDDIDKMVRLGVDNIITDDALNAKSKVVIAKTKTEYMFLDLMKLLGFDI